MRLRFIIIGFSIFGLFGLQGCGGGSSSNGAGQAPDSIVGVFSGSENIREPLNK